MTTRSLILAGGLLLATTVGAFAQSHQGGYLGVNPGAGVPASHGVAVEHGSGQGGYLGIDPGDHVGPSIQAPPAEEGSGQGGYLGNTPRVMGVRG